MKKSKIKSFCKINLFLRVLKRLKNGYHNINSLITFCGIYDVISINKIKTQKDKITFSGKFKRGIKNQSNTVTKTLYLLRKSKLIGKQNFRINIQKNIPHGSGLGGGSSNAAELLNFFSSKFKKKIKKEKIKEIAEQIGFDTPINLEKKNTFLTGKGNQFVRLKKKFRFNVLIIYPNLVCSTKKIYQKNKTTNKLKTLSKFHLKNNKKLITFLKKEGNDLEKTVIKIYPRIKKIIDFIKNQEGCYFSRITGSGSACIGIFSNHNRAIYCKKKIKLKFPKYWCVVSKTI